MKELVAAFLVGGFPWLSQLKKLKIHFELNKKVFGAIDPRAVFNFFAMLFGLAVFLPFVLLEPDSFVAISTWQIPAIMFASAFLLVLAFLILRVKYYQSVRSGKLHWPIYAGLVCYIAMFSLVVGGFRILLLHQDNRLIVGRVVDAATELPISGATVEISESDISAPLATMKTDDNGCFRRFIRREELAKVRILRWSADGYKIDWVNDLTGEKAADRMKTLNLYTKTHPAK